MYFFAYLESTGDQLLYVRNKKKQQRLNVDRLGITAEWKQYEEHNLAGTRMCYLKSMIVDTCETARIGEELWWVHSSAEYSSGSIEEGPVTKQMLYVWKSYGPGISISAGKDQLKPWTALANQCRL